MSDVTPVTNKLSGTSGSVMDTCAFSFASSNFALFSPKSRPSCPIDSRTSVEVFFERRFWINEHRDELLPQQLDEATALLQGIFRNTIEFFDVFSSSSG